MTANPSLGVATLTSFALTASATDPDGDTLTYDWELGDGSRASGPALGKTYLTTGPATIILTVTDGRGGSATESRTITVGTLNGTWTGTVNFGGNDNRVSTMNLTQVPGVFGIVTGTLTMAPGFKGLTDPAQFGRIDSSGAFESAGRSIPSSTSPCAGRWIRAGRGSPAGRSAPVSSASRSCSTSADAASTAGQDPHQRCATRTDARTPSPLRCRQS